jgi:folate-dependent phosphoribosylglycinamide formyltransferase PurN
MAAVHPLKIVVFTGGAELQSAVVDFIERLESNESLDLVGVFCETDAPGAKGVLLDLWRRRGVLSLPLLLQRWLRIVARTIFQPRRVNARRRTRKLISPRLHYQPDLHSEVTLARIRALHPDLGLVYGGPILRSQLFELPRLGTLGIHHGMVPDYRGKKTTFWAMYNGEPSVGVIIQVIGSGLDKGDVVLDARMPVGRAPLPVVSARLEHLGLDLYMQAIEQVRTGTACYRPQGTGSGPLYRDPSAMDLLRFWARYLHRLFLPVGKS